VVKNRSRFTEDVRKALGTAAIKPPALVLKAIMDSFSTRDETAPICTDEDGKPEPDSDLRDFENIPLKEDVATYISREVIPHVPDAWVDESLTRVGYEINFNRYFYKYQPPRPLEEIQADLTKIEQEILDSLKGTS